jgi:outer membrane autotransporter protein
MNPFPLPFPSCARLAAGLALMLSVHAAMAQSVLPPGTSIRVLAPDGLVIDGNGQTNGGRIEVRDSNGQPLANAALTRSRIDSAGVVQGTGGGLATNASGVFSQGTLSWGTSEEDLKGGANRYCLDNVLPAEATQACVDVTVLGTVITSVRGTKAYTLGGAAIGAQALAAARTNTTTAMQGVRIQLDHAQARMRTLRQGSRAAWVNDSTVQINGRNVPLSSEGAAGSDESGPDATRSEGWGAYMMGTLDVQEAKTGSALKVKTNGLSIGTDYRLSRRAVLGASFGHARSSSDLSGLSDAQTSSGNSLTLYGSFEPAAAWYIDAALSLARNDFSLKRNTSTGGQAHADTRGSGTGMSLTTGYQLLGRATVVSPYARIETLRVKVDGYTETGDTPFSVNEQRVRSNAIALGTEAQFIFATRYAIVVPHGRVELQRQSERNDSNLNATLVGSDLELVAEPSAAPDKNFGLWSLGLSAQFKRGVAAFIDYEQLFGKSDLSDRRVNLGMKVEF